MGASAIFIQIWKEKITPSQEVVAYVYNPSYLGGW
jgi:hypothetical protein